MRVLTTTLCYPTPPHPDQGIFVQRRTAALAALPDVQVRVVSPQLWCPILRRQHAVAATELSGSIFISRPRMFSIPVLGWAVDGVAYAATLSRAIRAASPPPDLIDAHFEYPDGVGAWLAGKRYGIPVCVTVRGKIVSLSRRALRRLQIAAMLRGVDGRIAVSRSLTDWIHRLAGSDLAVEVIPNGVDPTVYHLMPQSKARQALGWDVRARYILIVGHFQRLKGFDRILRIVPEVRAAHDDVRFVFVGSRRGERGYQRQLARLAAACNTTSPRGAISSLSSGGGVHPAVIFLDPVSAGRLNLMYNAADVLVSASRSEGWCNAIAEALAVGTPVVATDVGGNCEQLAHTETGLLVPDGDLAALQAAICDVLTGSLRRHAAGDLPTGRDGIRTWSQAATEVHAVFTRVLATRLNRVGVQGLIGVPAAEATP